MTAGLALFIGIRYLLGADNPNRPNRLPEKVSVSGIPGKGQTDRSLAKKLSDSVSHACETNDMCISFPGKTLVLSPEATGVHWDIEGAVSSALNATGISEQEIPLRITFDVAYVRQQIIDYLNTLGGLYMPSGCWLEGEAPDPLYPDDPCQVLVMNKGRRGIPFDMEAMLTRVREAYEKDVFLITVEELEQIREPAPLDLDALFRQVSIPAVNPHVDKQTWEVIPGTQGYGFDPEKAKALLESSTDEIVRMDMEYLAPTITEEDAWFADTLGGCKTPHSDNPNRTDNLILACKTLNGLILEPGQSFSYNETLGKRTADRGYKAAPAYSGTELVDSLGGGICQVSSTLYLASLFAELKVLDRRNHGFPVDYIPLGLDATVNWGTTDLKLRNDSDHAVKILAEVNDGYVYVRIMGVEPRDYYVKMEYIMDTPEYVSAYRCRFSRTDDTLISRSLDHTSVYLDTVWTKGGFAESAQ